MTIALRPPGLPQGYATIALSDYRSAQGPVLRRHLDGRVTIDTGNARLTGRPLRPAPGPAPVWMPILGGLF